MKMLKHECSTEEREIKIHMKGEVRDFKRTVIPGD